MAEQCFEQTKGTKITILNLKSNKNCTIVTEQFFEQTDGTRITILNLKSNKSCAMVVEQFFEHTGGTIITSFCLKFTKKTVFYKIQQFNAVYSLRKAQFIPASALNCLMTAL